MSQYIFSNGMYGAPVLNGAAGSVTALLDACLVNGWALPSITSITRSGATATVLFSATHNITYPTRITISGCTEVDYNGSFVVTASSTTEVTYTVANSPATPATGTPAASVTTPGWSKTYTGTNLGVYRAGTGVRHYLRVDDAATNIYFGVRGYETMTDVNTGTNPFPTVAQVSTPYMFKSSTTDTVARPWIIIASEKYFYFYVARALTPPQTFADSTTYQPAMFFGEIDSYLPGDGYHSALIFANTSATAATQLGGASESNISITGHYIARAYTQVAGAVNMSKWATAKDANSLTNLGTAGATYPDPVTGGIMMTPVYVHETSAIERGAMPAMYNPCHNLPGNPADVFAGKGSLSGRRFLLLDLGSGTTRGRVVMDITP